MAKIEISQETKDWIEICIKKGNYKNIDEFLEDALKEANFGVFKPN